MDDAGEEEEEEEEPLSDLLGTAESTGQFATLLAAVDAAGLADTLRGDGPFTLFAPSDAAFSALPDGVVTELLRPENRERLTALLRRHVVRGEVDSHQVLSMGSARTLLGDTVSVEVEADVVRVGGATVVQADVWACNGVIHVIDAVLLPEG